MVDTCVPQPIGGVKGHHRKKKQYIFGKKTATATAAMSLCSTLLRAVSKKTHALFFINDEMIWFYSPK